MKAVLFLAAIALFMATFVKATTDDECLGCADKIKTAVEYCDVSHVTFLKKKLDMIKEALDQAIVPLALKQFRTIPQNTLKANLNERERCVVMLVGYGGRITHRYLIFGYTYIGGHDF